jgi:hypothetical protein
VARGAIVLAALLVSSLLAVLAPGASVGAPVGAGVSVTPDVANLRAGALPRLPYVDWAARRIVDGNRRISISGIQSRVISLHKVDGGYILGRENPRSYDLVFVTYTGARRVLVAKWQPPRTESLDPALAVSRRGDKVIVNTATLAGRVHTYVDTRVVALPSGQVLRTRDFGYYAPSLHGFGIDRTMLTVSSEVADPPDDFYPDVRWWNPATNEVTSLLENASAESVDLSAWQWAVRPQVGVYSVQGLPSHTEPNWVVGAEDIRLGPWSLNDAYLAGNNEVVEDEAESYQVHRTSDGSVVFRVQGHHPPQITWENNSTLLLRTRIDGTRTYQLIRCTLAGSCYRVGPSTTDVRGAIIPAHRRNS